MPNHPDTTAAASYVHGVSEIPLSGATVGSLFDQCAARFPDRDALIIPYQDIRWTWADLREEVDRLAAGLLALVWSPATGSVSGRRTGPNGSQPSLPPPRPG